MEPDNLKRVILKYKELLPTEILKRDVEILSSKLDKANVIVGPRRSGKTFFLYDIVKGKKSSPVLINFEDNLLVGLKREDLSKILDYSKELFEGRLTFYFDEIQNVDKWENFIITLLNEHYEVYITGSNSKLLSKEIASSLRGKSLSYLMLPFSFSEFLRAKKITLEKNFEYTDKVYKVKKQFSIFMKYGGFPEIVFTNQTMLKNKLINNYFDTVLYKDLVDRLQIKNIKLLEITMNHMINLFSNTFSIVAYENYLKSNKIPYSLENLYIILKSLQDVFLIGYVKKYSKSFKKMELSKSKIYLFDTGYIQFLSNEFKDYGRILENIVFIELFRRKGDIENKSIFYYKSKEEEECDFVVKNNNKIEVIQVTYEMNHKNRKREIDGLLSAIKFFKLKEGTILTYDQEDEINIEKYKIKIKPIWKWLLEK